MGSGPALRRVFPVGARAEAFHHEIHEGANLGGEMAVGGVEGVDAGVERAGRGPVAGQHFRKPAGLHLLPHQP